MSDIQTTESTPSKPVPTVQQFKEVVNEQLTYWSETNVGGLCTSQTQNVINGLVPYYGTPENQDAPELDVDTFKEVVSDFQQQKERVKFAELTDPEVTELIAALAPHFYGSVESTED